RRTRGWAVFAWFGTMVQLLAGLVLVRMPNWSAGWVMLRSLFGLDLLAGWSPAVPVWVPLLVLLVVVGHLFSGLRNRVCGLLELPSPLRAAAYVVSVVLVVP